MILLRYVTRVYLTRFLAVLAALTALVELLSMLNALRHLVGAHSSLINVLIFSVLQLPLALEQLFLLAVAIGGVLTFRAMVSANEMVVLRGSGMSPYRLIACLLPLTVVFALCYYGIVDHLAPRAERAFTEWWHVTVQSADEDGDEPESKGPIWLRSGDEIVSVDKVSEGGKTLEGVTRYLRRPNGTLTGRISAQSATAAAGGWQLHRVKIVRLNGQAPRVESQDEFFWRGGPAAKNFEELALPTRRMGAAEGRKVLAGDWAGMAGTAHYRTLVQKSYAAPFLPFLMLLLAMPALTGNGRRNSVRGMAASISMALLFLVANGFFNSMSEASVLSPRIAVWTAPAAFLLLGLWMLLRNEE